MMRKEDKFFLQQLPFFIDLNDDELETVFSRLVSTVHSQGETIFKEGDPGSGLFIVRKGTIEIYRSDSRKEFGDHLLCKLSAGETFGDYSLLAPGKRLTTAVVGKSSHLFLISSNDFDELINEEAQLAVKLMRSIARKLILPFQRYPDLFLKALDAL